MRIVKCCFNTIYSAESWAMDKQWENRIAAPQMGLYRGIGCKLWTQTIKKRGPGKARNEMRAGERNEI